jgi:PAS domain S-box-containing protein
MSGNRPQGRAKPARRKRATGSRRTPASKQGQRPGVKAERNRKTELRNHEERFRAFANLSADWIWETDENFRYTFIQTREGMMFGRPAAELVGKNRLETLSVDRTSAAWHRQLDLFKKREPFRDLVLPTILGQNPGWMSTSAAPIFDEDGVFKGYRGVTRNVTRQKRAEAALELRERCLDGIGDAVIIGDANDTIVYVNPAFERLTGFLPAEAVGLTSSFLLGPEPDVAVIREIRAALDKGAVYRGRTLCYRKDHSAFWTDLTVSALRDDSGQMTHWVGVQADVTEQCQLEAQLRQAQKMEAIGALTGGIAHDFNNLLTIIVGNSELLVEDLGDDEMRTLASMIQSAAARGAELTQRLLSFGRRQTLASESLDLNTIIEGMAEMSRRTIIEDITLQIELHAARPIAVADRSQLETALLNLIVNARDAMPDGGVLSLKTHEITVAAGDFGAALTPGSYPAVTVIDSGVGMPPAVLERAFEPFFTTKDPGKGTGLGLAMVHGFAQQSSGHVVIKSIVGEGTTVTLILPRGQLAAGKAGTRDKARKVAKGRERILVVEDERDVRRYVSSQLRGFGYDVVEAATGAAALQKLGEDECIALLFTDVVLPEGMSGAELAELARSLRPDLKILFTSGYSEDVFSRHRELLKDPLLRKPYNRRQLAEALRNVLDIPIALSA